MIADLHPHRYRQEVYQVDHLWWLKRRPLLLIFRLRFCSLVVNTDMYTASVHRRCNTLLHGRAGALRP